MKVVPLGDYAGAAKYIVEILQNEDLRRTLSAEAYKSLESFSQNNIMKEWNEVFDGLIHRNRRKKLSVSDKLNRNIVNAFICNNLSEQTF